MAEIRTTYGEAETILLGEEFSHLLRRGDVVAIFGDLGSGKTHFIQGVCKGLGVREHVASPTFTIVNEYHVADTTIYHFDFYRLNLPAEIREIGFEEYLSSPDAICLIEWADRVREFLPAARFDVHMKLGENNETREIVITEPAGSAV